MINMKKGLMASFMVALMLVTVISSVSSKDISASDEETIKHYIFDNNPPDAPIIKGKRNIHEPGPYNYKFKATDPDGDDVRYFIAWGDGTSEWTDFYASGEEITISHTWYNLGSAILKARANDTHGALGPWGYLPWSISKKDNNEIEPLDDYEEIITFIDGTCNNVTTKGIYIKRDVTFQAGENTGLEISGYYRPWNHFNEVNVVYIHAHLYIGVIYSYYGDMTYRIWGIAIGNIDWECIE
jgi:hypothetical protein